jgi:putative redox protein
MPSSRSAPNINHGSSRCRLLNQDHGRGPRPRSSAYRTPEAAGLVSVPGRVGGMANGSVHRSVTVERAASGRFTATNARGGQITLAADSADFTPTELLLAAIGGCTAIDVDILTSRRAEPEAFEVLVEADKIRDTGGNRLTGISVTFRITFPAGEQGDRAKAVLPHVVKRSHDWLCTVGRTVEIGTPITTRIELTM